MGIARAPMGMKPLRAMPLWDSRPSFLSRCSVKALNSPIKTMQRVLASTPYQCPLSPRRSRPIRISIARGSNSRRHPHKSARLRRSRLEAASRCSDKQYSRIRRKACRSRKTTGSSLLSTFRKSTGAPSTLSLVPQILRWNSSFMDLTIVSSTERPRNSWSQEANSCQKTI